MHDSLQYVTFNPKKNRSVKINIEAKVTKLKLQNSKYEKCILFTEKNRKQNRIVLGVVFVFVFVFLEKKIYDANPFVCIYCIFFFISYRTSTYATVYFHLYSVVNNCKYFFSLFLICFADFFSEEKVNT